MPVTPMNAIRIVGAREHNLRGVSLTVPRNAVTVFTGMSGSGKSSLVFDTIAAEAQRQLNETFTSFVRHRLPSYGRPDVDRIEGLSPVVVVDQRRLGGNARSTLGTATDAYALLRLLYSRAGEPHLGESTAFSFNDPAGMCPTCSGLGRVVAPVADRFVDPGRTLPDGAVLLPGFGPGKYWNRQYVDSGLFPVDTPVGRWPAATRRLLLEGAPGDGPEGLLAHFNRIYLHAEGQRSPRKGAVVERFTAGAPCPDCHGARLNEAARGVRVAGRTIVECAAMEVAELAGVLRRARTTATAPIVDELVAILDALDGIGLGYLHLGREAASLSGGEAQRVKLVRHLSSSLTEMLYVFDEPSAGLHPADVARLTALLRRLRDKPNTVLVVEHDPDVIAVADHVVELGPGAGVEGGRVVFEGTVAALARSDTPTGRAMRQRSTVRDRPRRPTGALRVTAAARHNLRDVDVEFPAGVLTALTGVAGSGKSSLVSVLLEQHPDGVLVDQSAVTAGRRSTVATYTGIADPVRRLFARRNGVSPALFSANSAGACPECRGLGVIRTDLAFMDSLSVVCPQCHGRRFTADVLRHTVDGRSIADVLDLTVDQAAVTLDGQAAPTLAVLVEVGLGHLRLGQPLTTLSGGEAQRLKLAAELRQAARAALFVFDEPTTGLHPLDVRRLLDVFDRLVDAGATVVVVEHNLDVIRHADRVVDLGPGAGRDGGRVLFSGTPDRLAAEQRSATGRHLR